MSRFFAPEREIEFINVVTQELIQHVVGEEINYYAISKENTKTNKLYRETVKKVWAPPVKVNALVYWDNPQTTSTPIGQDSKYEVEVYIHAKELVDRNLVASEGDFVEYGQVFFEITSATQPQLVFGQINNRVMWKLVCVPSRQGQFQNGNDDRLNKDNSHPVQQAPSIEK
ncbi:MAG: hypothetical protein ACYDHY_07720 [Acidiferrobacterales bacterium]